MIPNLTAIIIIIATTPALILLMFLPAFIELKKPKDHGPRTIAMEKSEMNSLIARLLPIANIEDEQNFDSSLIQGIAKIVDFLPSLEV
jgi:hypothetical protein